MSNIQENPALEEINYKRLLIQTLVGTFILVVVCIILSLVFNKSLSAFSKGLVEQYGSLAVFTGFFITAICPVPLPDHALSAFALVGGMNFWTNITLSTLGSVSGGIIAYYMGKLLKNTGLYNRLMKRYKPKAEHLINRYGAKGLAIAALTPIPDSPVFWICGALDLPFKKFFLILLVCRFIKITYVLWLIKLGVLVF